MSARPRSLEFMGGSHERDLGGQHPLYCLYPATAHRSANLSSTLNRRSELPGKAGNIDCSIRAVDNPARPEPIGTDSVEVIGKLPASETPVDHAIK